MLLLFLDRRVRIYDMNNHLQQILLGHLKKVKWGLSSLLRSVENNSIQSRFKINGQSLLEDLKYASISRFHFLNVGWAVYKSGIPIWLPQGLRHNRLLIMHPSRPINTPIWRWDVTYILNLNTFTLTCRPHFQYRKGNELSSRSLIYWTQRSIDIDLDDLLN